MSVYTPEISYKKTHHHEHKKTHHCYFVYYGGLKYALGYKTWNFYNEMARDMLNAEVQKTGKRLEKDDWKRAYQELMGQMVIARAAEKFHLANSAEKMTEMHHLLGHTHSSVMDATKPGNTVSHDEKAVGNMAKDALGVESDIATGNVSGGIKMSEKFAENLRSMASGGPKIHGGGFM